MEEQRCSKRIPLRKEVRYGKRLNPLGYIFKLSESGMGVKGYQMFSTPSRIVEMEGEVKWVSSINSDLPSGMGICFLSYAD